MLLQNYSLWYERWPLRDCEVIAYPLGFVSSAHPPLPNWDMNPGTATVSRTALAIMLASRVSTVSWTSPHDEIAPMLYTCKAMGCWRTTTEFYWRKTSPQVAQVLLHVKYCTWSSELHPAPLAEKKNLKSWHHQKKIIISRQWVWFLRPIDSRWAQRPCCPRFPTIGVVFRRETWQDVPMLIFCS